MGFFDPFGGAADVGELKSDLSSVKSDVEAHINNNDIHVTASDKSNWDSKLDKNQGIENSGKVLGTNADGEVIPLNGYGFEYDEETKMLKYGTDPTSNLNQGIGLDDTLSKRGYAADAGAVGELKSDLDKLFVEEKYTWEIGSISNSSGNDVSFNTRIRTGYIPVSVGDRFKVDGNENLILAALYSEDKTFLKTTNNGNFYYAFTSDINGYARLVMRKDSSNSEIVSSDIEAITNKLIPNGTKHPITDDIDVDIAELQNDVNEIKSSYKIIENWGFDSETDNKYVNNGGTESSNTSFAISKPIRLNKGDSIIFTAQGYLNYVSMISEILTDNTYRVLIKSIDSTIREYTYTADRSIDIALCYNKGFTHICDIKREKYASVDDVISIKRVCDYTSLFKNCVCIGDSLTRGYQAEYEIGQRNRDGGYPTRLSRITRLNVYNFGISGATPTSWLQNTTVANYDYSKFDLALICLGRNGSLSSDSDKESYNTIIDMLKTANPNMIIFCLSLPPSNNDDSVINETIKSIATSHNVHYLDISTDSEVNSGKYRSDGIHYYPLGYMMLADSIKDRLCRYIEENQSDFMCIYTQKTYADVIADIVN